jgi:hypothetical protein
MLQREHPLVNPWRKFGPFQGLCQHRENTNPAITGVVFEPTVPGLEGRAVVALPSAQSPSLMFNMHGRTRPEL